MISGPMLFLSPEGALMKLSVDVLKGTPFTNFVIPGSNHGWLRSFTAAIVALGGGDQYLQEISLVVDSCMGCRCNHVNLDSCGNRVAWLYQLFAACYFALGHRDYYFDSTARDTTLLSFARINARIE
jgi:hypothetical protein